MENKIKSYSIRITFQGPNVITVSQYDFFSQKILLASLMQHVYMPKTATISCNRLVFHPPFCPRDEITWMK